MQSYLWMRPALQISEAVLLPALPRRSVLTEARISDRFTSPSTEPFRPVPEEGIAAEQPVALSTYVRPRGSMAGRGRAQGGGREHEPLQPMGPAGLCRSGQKPSHGPQVPRALRLRRKRPLSR